MATVTLCDKCGKEGANPRFVWNGGSQPDPALGFREETGEYKDLCDNCELILLRRAVARLGRMTEFRSDISVERVIAGEMCAALGIAWKGAE